MAVYRVMQERLLLQYKYLNDTGEPAKHNTDKDDLAVDERGKPVQAWGRLERGSLIYTATADYNKMSEEDKKNARYCDNNAVLVQLLDRGKTLRSLNADLVPAIEKVNLSSEK